MRYTHQRAALRAAQQSTEIKSILANLRAPASLSSELNTFTDLTTMKDFAVAAIAAVIEGYYLSGLQTVEARDQKRAHIPHNELFTTEQMQELFNLFWDKLHTQKAIGELAPYSLLLPDTIVQSYCATALLTHAAPHLIDSAASLGRDPILREYPYSLIFRELPQSGYKSQPYFVAVLVNSPTCTTANEHLSPTAAHRCIQLVREAYLARSSDGAFYPLAALKTFGTPETLAHLKQVALGTARELLQSPLNSSRSSPWREQLSRNCGLAFDLLGVTGAINDPSLPATIVEIIKRLPRRAESIVLSWQLVEILPAEHRQKAIERSLDHLIEIVTTYANVGMPSSSTVELDEIRFAFEKLRATAPQLCTLDHVILDQVGTFFDPAPRTLQEYFSELWRWFRHAGCAPWCNARVRDRSLHR